MNQPTSNIRRLAPLLFGVAASILYTYIIGLLDAADYLVEQWSVWIIEVPFIVAWAVFDRKYGWRTGLAYAFAGAMISFGLSWPDHSIAPAVYVKIALTGIILGETDWFAGPFVKRLAGVSLPGVVLAFVFGIPIILRGVSPEIMDRFRQDALDMYRAFMSEDEALKSVENAMEMFKGIFKAGFGMFLIGAVSYAWLSFLGSRIVFPRFGEEPEQTPRFHEYRLPFHAIWLFLASFGLLMAEVDAVFPVALNLFIVSAFFYGIQGLAVFVHYMNRFELGVVPRVVFWLLFFVTIAFTGLVLLFTGLIDTWFNLRRTGTENGEPTPGNME